MTTQGFLITAHVKFTSILDVSACGKMGVLVWMRHNSLSNHGRNVLNAPIFWVLEMPLPVSSHLILPNPQAQGLHHPHFPGEQVEA